MSVKVEVLANLLREWGPVVSREAMVKAFGANDRVREQLAQRFGDVISPYGDRLLDEDGWLSDLADECIRQMRWARSQVYSVPGGPPYLTAAIQLEPAPEDWQP